MKKQTYLEFIHEILNNQEEFESFVNSYKNPVNKSIKIIDSKTDRKQLIKQLNKENWTLSAPRFSNEEQKYDDLLFVQKEDKQTLWNHFLHQAGFYYIQEISAGLPAQLMDLSKWELVLDLCAAPGWKSVQIADQLLQKWAGFLLSNEPSNPRRKALIHNINRCWMLNTAISAYNAKQIGDLCPESFDKILLDAPCSGEWMQYKHDKNVNYWNPKLANKFAKTQKQLFHSALKALKTNWTLYYATCTLNPLENEWVIAWALSQFWEQIVLENIEIQQKSPWLNNYQNQKFFENGEEKKLARFWPHIQQTGWFFIAKIKKLAHIDSKEKIDKRVNKNFSLDQSKDLQKKVWQFMKENRDISKQEEIIFLASPNAIYASTSDYNKISKKLFIEKVWIPIIKISQKWERIPQNGIATIFGNHAKKNTISINIEQAKEIMDSKIFSTKDFEQGTFVIIKLDNYGLALAKQDKEVLKLK